VDKGPISPNPPGAVSNSVAPAAGGPPRRVRSEELLKGEIEIVIDHHGREYRLRVTQNGKLILTA
jgi:hemin uptake protein HemP